MVPISRTFCFFLLLLYLYSSWSVDPHYSTYLLSFFQPYLVPLSSTLWYSIPKQHPHLFPILRSCPLFYRLASDVTSVCVLWPRAYCCRCCRGLWRLQTANHSTINCCKYNNNHKLVGAW